MNIFDIRRKEIAKWLKNCDKKEKEIPNDAEDLDEALAAVQKVKVVSFIKNSVASGTFSDNDYTINTCLI